jgi:hypothetical protein
MHGEPGSDGSTPDVVLAGDCSILLAEFGGRFDSSTCRMSQESGASFRDDE